LSENGYLKSRIKAILIALDGIKYVFMSQKNTRIHAGFTLGVFLLGWLLKINRIEWTTLLLVVGLVWVAEFLNTAVEVMIDIVSPEKNQAAKIGKDVSAGGVLIAAFVSILIGILIFGPRLWQWVMDILK
jgi:diacylglycerol kinase